MKKLIVVLAALLSLPFVVLADEDPTTEPIPATPKGLATGRPKAPAHVYLTVDYVDGMMTFSSTADLGDLDVTITSNTTGQTWTFNSVALDIPVFVSLPDDVYTLYIESADWTFTSNNYVVD